MQRNSHNHHKALSYLWPHTSAEFPQESIISADKAAPWEIRRTDGLKPLYTDKKDGNIFPIRLWMSHKITIFIITHNLGASNNAIDKTAFDKKHHYVLREKWNKYLHDLISKDYFSDYSLLLLRSFFILALVKTPVCQTTEMSGWKSIGL